MPPIRFDPTGTEAARILAAANSLLDSGSITATRADLEARMTGGSLTDASALLKPGTYYEMVDAVRKAYRTDPLFGYLINRAVQFGSTETRFRALSEKDHALPLDDLLNEIESKGAMSEATRQEQDFWDAWTEALNEDLDNELSGIDIFKQTNLKNLLLDAMSTIVFQMGTLKVGNVEYTVPRYYTTLPAITTILSREEASVGDLLPREKIYINTSENVDLLKMPQITSLKAGTYAPVRPLSDFDPLDLKPRSRTSSKQFGFALKYLHSSADPSTIGRVGPTSGKNTQIHGIYPTPPFASLQAAFKIREQGAASDLAVLDGIINQILYFQIGNKDAPILPDKIAADGTVEETGTMKRVADLLAFERAGRFVKLLLPWYVELKKIETDASTLTSYDKFLHSTLSIYAAFGIIIAPPNVRESFEQMNRTNFEEFLDNLVRNHHTRFMRMLARKIVEWNPKKLSRVPMIYDLPTNTKAAEFSDFLLQLRDRGQASSQTILEHAGLAPDYELSTVAREVGTGRNALEGENVPISLVQKTSDGEESAEGGPATPGSDSQGDGNKTKQSKPSGKRRSGNRAQTRPRK